MLARTADSLFWMSRYMERVDILLRTLSNGFYASYDVSDSRPFNWMPIVKMFCYGSKEELADTASSANKVLKSLMVEDETNSLKVLVAKARENARGTQEHLTREVWEAINEKYHSANGIDIDNVIDSGKQMDTLLRQTEESLIYYGVFENTMPRGQGWNFMNLGRFIERGIQTLSFAEEKFQALENTPDVESSSILYWKNLLLNLSGYELYLKSYRGGDHSENIIDMIFLNPNFPRSMAYIIKKIQLYINNILKEIDNPNNKLVKRKAGLLWSKIEFTDLEQIQQKKVLSFITELKADLYQLSQLVGQSYFSYY